MTVLKAAGLSMLMCLVVACGARSKLSSAHEVTTSLKPYTKAVLSVSATSVDEDVVEQKAELERLAAPRLQSLGVFEDVHLSTNGEVTQDAYTLHIRATMTDIRKVGKGKRFMLGALAGRSGIECRVEFLDPEGTVLGAYDVKGESGGSGLAGGTDDAVKKTAEGIANAVRDAYRI